VAYDEWGGKGIGGFALSPVRGLRSKQKTWEGKGTVNYPVSFRGVICRSGEQMCTSFLAPLIRYMQHHRSKSEIAVYDLGSTTPPLVQSILEDT